ncbi:glycosyltransferase family 2 protein, partial [Streptococcus uberis]
GYKKNRAFHTFVFRMLIITKIGYRRTVKNGIIQ